MVSFERMTFEQRIERCESVSAGIWRKSIRDKISIWCKEIKAGAGVAKS